MVIANIPSYHYGINCGFETNVQYKAYEHLNESDEEDKIYQEGMAWECESFREVN